MNECRYASIRNIDISNGPGIGVSVFFQGCPFHCKGCFNEETWDFNSGKPFDKLELYKVLDLLNESWVSRLSILGGEPLVERNYTQLMKLTYLAKDEAKSSGKDKFQIWLWTGRTYEDILDETENDPKHPLSLILKNLDYIVDGRFEEDKKDLTLLWRGSSNQRIIPLNGNKEIVNG